MTRKLLLIILSLLATVFLTSNVYAQPCSSGSINVIYNGIGSVAEFDTLGLGAMDALQQLSGYTGPTNKWGNNFSQVVDTRVGTIDENLKIEVIYDSAATCNVYIVWLADSVQGVKDFFCYGAVPTGTVGVVADCYGNHEPTGISWELAACATVRIFACAGPITLPNVLSAFLVAQPNPTRTDGVQSLPAGYCGQTATTASASSRYCYFNAAHTDVRPEDALFASNRAAGLYNPILGYSGLGYDQAACGAVGVWPKGVGCPIYDSFDQNLPYYPVGFAISGTDPNTGKNVPTYTTLNVGAVPIMVFVNNSDTSSLGFGAGYVAGGTSNYLFDNVNHKVLAHVFDGTDSCTGDLLSTPSGSGNPIQVLLDSPVGGSYNTLEFTGVRILSGSAVVAAEKISDLSWYSDDVSSQESDPYGNLAALGPAFNAPACNDVAPPSATCGDPLYNPTGTCGSNGTGVKLRAIGTGEEIKAGLAGYNSVAGNPQITDGIGYAFWGYWNFRPGASGCAGAGTSGDVACNTYLGHYLTVDGIDPLFTTPGGSVGSENPTGAYQFPQCGVIQPVVGYSYPCAQIPFTHIYDGSYPLWSQLRIVTFAKGTGQTVPAGVVAVLANAENEAAPGSTTQISEFVPLFSEVNLAVTPPTGNLNFGMFRSHYLQSKVDPNNGHSPTVCGAYEPSFIGIPLDNSSGCLVDSGGDMGGSVLTVQSDVDFNVDFGSLFSNYQLYGLHQ
jgi:hypothetical protein